MTQNHTEFMITKDNVKKMREELNLNKDGQLIRLFDQGRWAVEFDDDGNVNDIQFEGEKKGWGEDELFEKIAPFVKDGSFIEMHGEDGGMWRWVFKNGTCTEIYPTITWAGQEEGF